MEAWTEQDSQQFLAFADIITPVRHEQMAMLARLLPAAADEPFEIVELGCGGGDLAFHLLSAFPNGRYLGLDGSETMLAATATKLAPFGDRVRLEPFRLETFRTWAGRHCAGARAVVSSLVVHHLEHPEKAALYAELYQQLERGGVLLLADLVLPEAPHAQAALGANWDEVASTQSLAMTGVTAAFDRFKHEGWNLYTDPDPMDKPAPLFAQLQWLAAAGFRQVDCFWQRGGHAIYGGFK